MLRGFLALLFVAALCVTAYAFVNPPTPRPLADVAMQTPDGKEFRVNQYKGKVMVVALISTDCSHCSAAVQMLGRVQQEYGPRGFQAVVAAVNPSTDVRAFVMTQRPAFPVGHMEEDKILQLFAFQKAEHPIVPILMFVDKKGMVRFEYFGDNTNFNKDVEKNTRTLVEGLLK